MRHALRLMKCPWGIDARLRLGRCRWRWSDMSLQHCQELGSTCISGSHCKSNWHDTLSWPLSASYTR